MEYSSLGVVDQGHRHTEKVAKGTKGRVVERGRVVQPGGKKLR